MNIWLDRIVMVSGALLLMTQPGWAQGPGGGDTYAHGPHMMWGGAWYGMVLGPLFVILTFVAGGIGIALVARWFGAPGRGPGVSHDVPPRPAPLDILKERFARGEIDKEEFEERRRVLSD
jgi:putative membrane protein